LNIVIPGRVHQFLAVGLGIIKIAAVNNHLCAVTFNGRVHFRIVALRNHDRAGHVEPLSRPGHGQSVIAPGRHQNTRLEFLARHVMEKIERPPDFERACRIVIFVFNKCLAADETGELRIMCQIGSIKISVHNRLRHQGPGQIHLFTHDFVFFQHTFLLNIKHPPQHTG